MNGTTNFMLSKMESEGADYEEVLKEAQDLGYAEGGFCMWTLIALLGVCGSCAEESLEAARTQREINSRHPALSKTREITLGALRSLSPHTHTNLFGMLWGRCARILKMNCRRPPVALALHPSTPAPSPRLAAWMRRVSAANALS